MLPPNPAPYQPSAAWRGENEQPQHEDVDPLNHIPITTSPPATFYMCCLHSNPMPQCKQRASFIAPVGVLIILGECKGLCRDVCARYLPCKDLHLVIGLLRCRFAHRGMLVSALSHVLIARVSLRGEAINSVQTRGMVGTSGFTRGICKNRCLY